jgi:hypothetical protein
MLGKSLEQIEHEEYSENLELPSLALSQNQMLVRQKPNENAKEEEVNAKLLKLCSTRARARQAWKQQQTKMRVRGTWKNKQKQGQKQ